MQSHDRLFRLGFVHNANLCNILYVSAVPFTPAHFLEATFFRSETAWSIKAFPPVLTALQNGQHAFSDTLCNKPRSNGLVFGQVEKNEKLVLSIILKPDLLPVSVHQRHASMQADYLTHNSPADDNNSTISKYQFMH